MYENLEKSLRICEGACSKECIQYNTAQIDGDTCQKRLCGMAADAIEELQQIAGHYEECAKDYFKDVCYYLERMPKWISVEERLPEKYHQVLCYGVNGIAIDYYSGETSLLGRPLFMVSEARVTHWMPLPEPPKEEV